MTSYEREGPLLLLDGMSLIFRAYYALTTEISTSDGVVTNAVHGFASMLLSLIKQHKPSGIAVAFDLQGGTFRDAMTEDYKGGRDETPDDLSPQFGFVRELCESLNIPVIGVPGYEADDVLATLAEWAYDAQKECMVVTGDRDSFQLVRDPYIRVLYNRRGVSDYSIYDEAGITERCGIDAQRYPLLAALRGDPSDNLPGVPGVGEKTAAKLFASYRDLDELYAHLADLTPKLRENLALFEQRARNNVEVMTLIKNVSIPDFTLEDVMVGGWGQSDSLSVFDKLEMDSLKARFSTLLKSGALGGAKSDDVDSGAPTVADTPAATGVPHVEYQRMANLSELEGEINLSVFATRERFAAVGERSGYCWVGSVEDFKAWYRSQTVPLATNDGKLLMRVLGSDLIGDDRLVHDTSLMAFLINPSLGSYEFESLAQQFLELDISTGGDSLFSALNDDDLAYRASLIPRLIGELATLIAHWELEIIYHQIELPLVGVLARMEDVGIFVDAARLRTIVARFVTEANALEAEIQDLAGHPFKVNSPLQLQKILFEELGLSKGKKTKTGYSTDAGTLEKIKDEHEIVAKLLRYRELDKLRSTYGESLIACIQDDSRIHATFQQTVARTGRLSSDSPNLHNIPVRTAEGRQLREAFGPSPGWGLLVADYNQIELRVIAHLSHDEGLLAAFAAGNDIHRAIAATVFHTSVDAVSSAQREFAKAVSYGLAYGMESFGLSQRLGVPVGEAKSIIDQYFAGFPALKAYMENCVADARERGYSRTEMGRIRHFEDLRLGNGPQKAAAERQAMNAGIQGMAADIFKLALVRIDNALLAQNLTSRLVLQVHDEVLVEAPEGEKAEVEALVREAMLGAARLSVPMEISLHWGSNWSEAKGK